MLSNVNMTMETKKQNSYPVIFAALLACALGIRLAYVFMLPLGPTVLHRLEGLNDEPSHFNYVHYLAEHKQFPVQYHHVRESDSFVRNEFEYFQPPVYYVLGAGLELVFGRANSMVACRILSFFFGVLGLLVIKKIFSRLCHHGQAGDAAVLFTAFLPTNAYFCAVVSNDSLSWLFAFLVMLEMTKADSPGDSAQGRRVWYRSMRLGLLLGIGMLVKSSLFIFYPVVVVFFLYRWFISRKSLWLIAPAASLLLSVLICAPWYLHNIHVYGSLFAFGVGNGPAQFFLFSEHRFLRFWIMTFRYFWFPMQYIPSSHAVANIMRVEAFFVFVNAVACVFYMKSRKGFSFYAALCGLLVLVNVSAYIKFNLYWDNAEGRYFFPALVPILMLFCIPAYHYFRKLGLGIMILPVVCAEALFPYVTLLLVR
jgi:4-amino-4-deoxy-L-arabinose transferase-like glycosyltransferase